MIKRRFYRQEHAEANDASDDSSSSSDSELEAESANETEVEDDDAGANTSANSNANANANANADHPSCSSTSSGYKSEDSSANEVDNDSSGLPISDDNGGMETERFKTQESAKASANIAGILPLTVAERDFMPADVASCVLKCKSVFKCRLCPRIVCLNEESLKTHLNSKRHARSEKLLKEGRLRHMLNSDGELEEEQETHAERHARTIGLAQDKPKSKNKGRQRQRQRLKRKKNNDGPSTTEERKSGNGHSTKRHKGRD